jgi:SHS family lactate transporter-like MFS transporter
MASIFVVYYSIFALFATHLQKDLHYTAGLVATPLLIANLLSFLAQGFWGFVADRLGRRWAMIIPGALAILVAPIYLLTSDFSWIVTGFLLQGLFGGAIYSQLPSYLCERFPTEVRATASAFCYHQGAIWGALVPLVLAACSDFFGTGLVIPMLVATVLAASSAAVALLLSPETLGKELVPDLVVA